MNRKIVGRNRVRIIGGQFRRRFISFPDQQGLRPTPDRVKETLFNWLGQELYGMHCLDLFAGSGSLGFEAASRGAARVVMVDRTKPVLAALEENRKLLGANQVEIVAGDARHFVRGCSGLFDLIFLDPPFDSALLAEVLPDLARILKPGGRVYAECAHWPPLDGWSILREGRAGLVSYALMEAADLSSLATPSVQCQNL